MANGVGARLRTAREERGLSLADVEAVTRIRVHLLAAIEAEEWGRLPGDYYARAFLREYAEFLGLDPGPMLADFRPPAAAEEPLPAQIKTPRRTRPRWSRPAGWVPAVVALVVIVAVVALVAVALSSLGGGSARGPGADGGQPASGGGSSKAPAAPEPPTATAPPASPRETTLTLTATAEVWVCLLDRRGTVLVDGQILAAGAEVGPFSSGAYTLSLGNGSVEIELDGRAAPIPASADPTGYAIEAGGKLRELPPETRPTCT